MSRVLDVPPQLGQLMLQGWVLTDIVCAKCRELPKMRSPNGRTPVVELCVNCDSGNDSSNVAPNRVANRRSVASLSSDPNSSLSLTMSGRSTPPTEVSSTLSSPTFAIPVDTEEILRRRQQSDRASTEIGSRLLKGWAMLADECPSDTCFGVPLVRPPKLGGGKDPRKECVICGTAYVDEKDVNGWYRLARLSDVPGPSSESPAAVHISASDRSKGKGIVSSGIHTLPSNPINLPKHVSNITSGTPASGSLQPEPLVPSESSTNAALEASVNALEASLHALSRRLTSLTGEQLVVDPASISQTADAITKVSAALIQVKQLQWSEKGAGSSIY